MTPEPIRREDIARYRTCVRAERRMRQSIMYADRRIGIEPDDLERLLAALEAGEALASVVDMFLIHVCTSQADADRLGVGPVYRLAESSLARWRACVEGS